MRVSSRLLSFGLVLITLAACTTRQAAPPPEPVRQVPSGITPLTLEQDRMMRE